MFRFVDVDCSRCKSESVDAATTADIDAKRNDHGQIAPWYLSALVRRELRDSPPNQPSPLVWATARADGRHGVHLYVPESAKQVVRFIEREIDQRIAGASFVDLNIERRVTAVRETNPAYVVPFVISTDPRMDREMRERAFSESGKSSRGVFAFDRLDEDVSAELLLRYLRKRRRRHLSTTLATQLRTLRSAIEHRCDGDGIDDSSAEDTVRALLNCDNDVAVMCTKLLFAR